MVKAVCRPFILPFFLFPADYIFRPFLFSYLKYQIILPRTACAFKLRRLLGYFYIGRELGKMRRLKNVLYIIERLAEKGRWF
ncbi:hypothetical protein C1G86_0212 [Dehalococcoides mccartyi]|uniref:Uncharacterized protein n=1 Tax=Dehalococcoides mccartyi TaxID=61435 RepID=A0A328ESY2_9CHLR|nr:hypothetical protein C1G86_0212 [Dehalococcoides mccartyi]